MVLIIILVFDKWDIWFINISVVLLLTSKSCIYFFKFIVTKILHFIFSYSHSGMFEKLYNIVYVFRVNVSIPFPLNLLSMFNSTMRIILAISKWVDNFVSTIVRANAMTHKFSLSYIRWFRFESYNLKSILEVKENIIVYSLLFSIFWYFWLNFCSPFICFFLNSYISYFRYVCFWIWEKKI